MKRNLDKRNDEKQPERKRPALASVIVEAMKVDSLQKLCSSLEPILRRVVSEEVDRALAKFIPSRLAESSESSPKRISGPDGRNLQLRFRTRLSLPLFTGGRVEGEQGASIHVVLIDANTGRHVTFGPEASLKLEVVVLEGDFNKEDWSREEFESHVVKERDGKRPLLTGDLCVVLKEGVGALGEIVFTDNSSWIRSRKFRLALRVASGGCDDGVRVREAKTEAFTVKDHRGELYKKHYPPGLNDEVWRLEKIGKDGAFHKKLTAEGIVNVEDFLRKLVKNSAKLRAALGSGMSNKMWDVLVEHAKTCVLSGKLYIYYPEDSRTVGVVFNNIYELSGLISGDQYLSADSLDDSQKVYVDGLVKKAYDNWNQVIEYEGKTPLNFNQPKRVEIEPVTVPANYSVLPPSPIPPSQFPGFSFEGYSVLQQDQFMGIHQHQTQTQTNLENQNVTGMTLGTTPLQSTGGYPDMGSSSVHQANLDPLEEWSRQHENDLLSRSHEMLESEDMQQLLQLCSMGGGDGEAGYGFPSFMQNTPMVHEDRVRSGKAVVGWLKIKAAMKWGIFIRKKAAEKRRAQIVELD
ncbi:hypothetical protein Bca4012_088122 [Brassica carinata]|uniref:Uncharacterized protein n=1 Tax=Brassica carinata TaxID=52824 RepID=A0A8X7P9N5_BRACI|nr:hypothetical protein Bca52824_088212 [Brassica carinata]